MKRSALACSVKRSMRCRRGITLMEMLVALVIIAAMAAVIAPNVISALDRARINGAYKTLQGLSQGIRDFKADVGEYPLQLTQLSTPITTAHQGVCGGFYTNAPFGGEVGRWRGPYVDRALEAAGVPIGIGTATNLLLWNTNTILLPNINVDVADAIALDQLADAGDGAASGNVTWLGAGPIVGIVYNIPINGC